MSHPLWCAFAFGLLMLNVAPSAKAEDKPRKVPANTVAEWTFTSNKTYADPFNEVTLDAVFTTPDGLQQRVPAFWDGGQTWRVRYAAAKTGAYSFRTTCSDAANPDLQQQSGKLTVTPYRGKNPLYRHGPVQIAAGKRTFEHADGTPFLWLGDTWWMALSSRLRWPDEFQTLLADRKAKGFNLVQIVAGLYPEMPPLDPRGANEAGLPWEPEYRRIRPEYFQEADKRLQTLVENGMTPCIVGAWGYFQPFMGTQKLEQHWRYLIARYGALPVIWCVAGEVNLPYYKTDGFPFDDRNQVREWTSISRYVRENDPFRRVLTVHPTGLGKLSARGATTEASVLDYDMLQTGHGSLNDLAPTLNTIRTSYNALPTLPIVEGEVNYEALLSPEYNNASVQRLFVWNCLLNGCAGYTYGGNGIWQVNREGEPSVTFGGYTNIPWNKAMQLPGAAQVGLARKLLLNYHWEQCTPHPEWVTTDAQPPLTLEGSRWIWFPEGSPAQDAPTESRCFRRVFTLPQGKTLASARLKIAADDKFTVWLNGQELGTDANWKVGREFKGLEQWLKPGANVLAVLAVNQPAPVTQNPAGLIAKLELHFADGTIQAIVTNASWRTARQGTAGWRDIGFEDSAWKQVLALAPYGQGPWGLAVQGETRLLPCCAAIAGKLRIVYLPQAEPVTLTHLEQNKFYTAVWINPMDGQRTRIGNINGDANSVWHTPLPPKSDQDWLLVLTAG